MDDTPIFMHPREVFRYFAYVVLELKSKLELEGRRAEVVRINPSTGRAMAIPEGTEIQGMPVVYQDDVPENAIRVTEVYGLT